MKIRLRDIPPWAAVTVAALAMLVSVVAGREKPEAEPAVTPAAATLTRAAAQDAAKAPDFDLDLEKLKREKRKKSIADLFAPPPVPTPAVAKAGAAPKTPPTAPPLPFNYLGRFIDGDKVVVFLSRGDDQYSVSAGQTIENLYKVEQVTEAAVTFTYLPLAAQQVLTVPAPN